MSAKPAKPPLRIIRKTATSCNIKKREKFFSTYQDGFRLLRKRSQAHHERDFYWRDFFGRRLRAIFLLFDEPSARSNLWTGGLQSTCSCFKVCNKKIFKFLIPRFRKILDEYQKNPNFKISDCPDLRKFFSKPNERMQLDLPKPIADNYLRDAAEQGIIITRALPVVKPYQSERLQIYNF